MSGQYGSHAWSILIIAPYCINFSYCCRSILPFSKQPRLWMKSFLPELKGRAVLACHWHSVKSATSMDHNSCLPQSFLFGLRRKAAHHRQLPGSSHTDYFEWEELSGKDLFRQPAAIRIDDVHRQLAGRKLNEQIGWGFERH